jgi:hypothetical protein
MKEYDRRNSHINRKLQIIYLSSNDDRHPVTKTFITINYYCRHFNSFNLNFTQLHFTPLHYICRHFNFSNLKTSLFLSTLQILHFKLHPATLHHTSLHLSTLHFFQLKLHQTTLHFTTFVDASIFPT